MSSNIFNRIIVTLIGLAVAMQAASLYMQYQGNKGGPPRVNRPAAIDAPKGANLLLSGHPVKGDEHAIGIIVEFSDYECPFCQRHFDNVGKLIDEKYVDTGRLKHVFVNNPLPIHPDARLLAIGALCAGSQDHYWEMHDAIFANKLKSREELVAAASKININVGRFDKCLGEASISDMVDKDIKIATDLKFQGTPAFGLGRLDPSGHIELRRLISGAQPMPVFEKEIAQVLSD
jgi:protein-disulfide isomerase